MRRRLIVTADDAGIHPGMTEGAIRAHQQGIVTACSVVANGLAFDDAVRRLRDVPSLATGVHLTLVEERPLTELHFPRKYTSFVPLYLAGAIPLRKIEYELRAQIDRVVQSGLPVSHLNGHQHLHLLPGIFGIVSRLAEEFHVPYIRIVDERGDRAPVARRLAIRALSRLGRRARSSSTNDRTIGVAEAGHITGVIPLLDSVEGLTELVTHPGVNVGGYSWGYDWDAETRALCDPRLRPELEARGIELVSPRHI